MSRRDGARAGHAPPLRGARRVGTVAILLSAATIAIAHGVHQREGTATVGAGRVVTTMPCDAGSEQRLLHELVIRDEVGERLAGRVVSATPAAPEGHVLATLEHPLTHDPRWLSFQLAPGEAPTSLARRLELSVVAGGTTRVVDLTSGGNVETLRFPAADAPATCGAALLDAHPERLRSVQALLRREATSSRLDVVIPLGILESWLPLARADADFVSVAEQAAARDAVLALVRSRIRPAATSGDVAFLALDDAAIDSAPAPRRLSAWTARVRVSLRFDGRPPLEWDLFNALVLTARVVVTDGASCDERRVSTYAPRVM